MSIFNHLLSSGDLRSDGSANEVVRIVSEHPELLPELVDALASDDPAVRGHAADAFEKLARTHPQEAAVFLPRIVQLARSDSVAMVRWHLAMALGHLSNQAQSIPEVIQTLRTLLYDASPFVRSWAITSLCIIAQKYPDDAEAITQAIAVLSSDSSAAVAKRVQMALQVLSKPGNSLPKSWIKTKSN
jgi:HEAT repeat protein